MLCRYVMDFHFLVMEMSWKSHGKSLLKKSGHPAHIVSILYVPVHVYEQSPMCLGCKLDSMVRSQVNPSLPVGHFQFHYSPQSTGVVPRAGSAALLDD